VPVAPVTQEDFHAFTIIDFDPCDSSEKGQRRRTQIIIFTRGYSRLTGTAGSLKYAQYRARLSDSQTEMDICWGGLSFTTYAPLILLL